MLYVLIFIYILHLYFVYVGSWQIYHLCVLWSDIKNVICINIDHIKYLILASLFSKFLLSYHLTGVWYIGNYLQYLYVVYTVHTFGVSWQNLTEFEKWWYLIQNTYIFFTLVLAWHIHQIPLGIKTVTYILYTVCIWCFKLNDESFTCYTCLACCRYCLYYGLFKHYSTCAFSTPCANTPLNTNEIMLKSHTVKDQWQIFLKNLCSLETTHSTGISHSPVHTPSHTHLHLLY